MKTNNLAARSTSFSLSITWIIDTNDTINKKQKKCYQLQRVFRILGKNFTKESRDYQKCASPSAKFLVLIT